MRTLFSGISRGTEALVLAGRVPVGERERMRAPMQEGDFPYPVKYGYAAVGLVEEGPLQGRRVFALAPHQDRFRAPAARLTPLPDDVPPGRAVLAANMETALTILWDAQPGPGDRIAVVGGGVVGLLAAWLAARIPGTEVAVIDLNPRRAALARALGCAFPSGAQDGTPPPGWQGSADVVIHASASAGGLATAIGLAGDEAVVIEASWHGAGLVPAPLGGDFHARRLTLRSSQVGRIPPARSPRWDHARRMAVAVSLLSAPVLDRLISGETSFDALPDRYPAILADPDTLCHRVRYEGE